MKNFNLLNQKLKKYEVQKKNFTNLENLSLFQFLNYKSIILKESKIKQKLQRTQKLVNEINFLYDATTKSWIENQNVNCRKYSRLKQKAEYQRDIKLYKLGCLEKKPLPPLLKKFKSYLPKIDFSKYNFLKKIHNKFISFRSNVLPKKINNLAINTAKIGIKGYRKLRSDYRFFRRYMTSRDSIKYLKNVLEQAKMQLEQSEIQDELYDRNITEKGAQFRESLKVKPAIMRTNSNNPENKISQPSQSGKIILNNPAEYTL